MVFDIHFIFVCEPTRDLVYSSKLSSTISSDIMKQLYIYSNLSKLTHLSMPIRVLNICIWTLFNFVVMNAYLLYPSAYEYLNILTTSCGLCDVVSYRERSIPLPFLYLNQLALTLTRSSYLHSVTCSLFNERSLGQSSRVVEEKNRMISPQTLRAKMPIPVREIWRRIFSLGQKLALERHAEFNRLRGKSP